MKTKQMTNLWERKQLKADYLVRLTNAYYYLVDHYQMHLGSPEQSAAELIRKSIRKIQPNFIG